eukprot:gb/GEZN01022700.1/.p1 GENE.gb/GEZN01022700.1/~~gb/GEZN01022700.1/.p1  ORF type:complete len:176 (+),score=45.33 gb/GEZN01022700.1/:29-556(+)
MGAGISQEDMAQAQKQCSFSEDELKRLFKKFKKLDKDGNGSLSIEEFMNIPELEHNPLVRRVVETFDDDKSGEVDFMEFIKALSVFATMEAKLEEKFKFTFRIYDVDGDGFISNADLYKVLKAMVGSNLSDTQLQQLVDRTIIKGDKDKDGKLNYSEFKEMVKDSSNLSTISIEL